ncbi:hypothetical protein H4219_004128, partial [Mycoemilia scoparia]
LKSNMSRPKKVEYSQVSNYLTEIWYSQIRNYVLAGLIKKNTLYIYNFARNMKAHVLCTGKVIPDKISELNDIKLSLKLLAFLMTLDEIGLGLAFTGGSHAPSNIYLYKQYPGPNCSDLVHTNAYHSNIDKYDKISITKHVNGPNRPFGRAPWISKIKCNLLPGDGYLKVNSQPAYRQSEIDVLKLLEKFKIQYSPILKACQRQEFPGNYSIKYMVFKDYGETIDEYFKKMNHTITGKTIRKIISRVATCILSAASKGILHCDISTGNILIDKDEEVMVIDWGYLKVVGDNLSKGQTSPDPITGTLPFMSIQVLIGCPDRSCIDDLESKFYVTIYSVAVKFNNQEEVDKLSFWDVNDPLNLARIRLSPLKSYEELKYVVYCFPEYIPDDIHEVLKQFHKILFKNFSFSNLKDLGAKVDPRAKIADKVQSIKQAYFNDALEEGDEGEGDDNDDDSGYKDGCVDDSACSRGLRMSKRIINKKNNIKLNIRSDELSLKPAKIPKISKFKH